MNDAADMNGINAALRDDDLTGAVAAAAAAVKTRPADAAARFALIDLLILQGNYERADRQADLAATFAPEQATAIGILRGLLRGMASRADWFERGATPSFPFGPSETDQAALRLALASRDGEADASALDALDTVPERRWRLNGRAINGLRDADDRTAHLVEAVTAGGAYLWIDLRHVTRMTLAAPRRPRDLAWREARVELHDGSAADLLVPLAYHPPAGHAAEDAHRLARRTDWVETGAGRAVAGLGARCWLAGDDLVALAEVEVLEAVHE